MKSCFFLGHRDAPDNIRDTLDEAIERHITEYGVTEFFVGHYGRFDRMAQAALVRANRYMIDHCDYMIAYVWHAASNARELLEYARNRKVFINNMGEWKHP